MLMDIKEVHFGDIVGHGAYGTVHKGTWQGKMVVLRISIPPGMDKTQMIASNQEIVALKYQGLCEACCQLEQSRCATIQKVTYYSIRTLLIENYY